MAAPLSSLRSLRTRNRRAVIAAVQDHPRASRADVARYTGLSTTTVSTLVAELVAAGVLVESGTTVPPAGGRPAVALGLHPRTGAVVGVHLGHAGTRVVVTGLDGRVLSEQAHRSDVDHEPARSLDRVGATADALLDETAVDRHRVFGVGVAVSAPVLQSRLLAAPPMLLDWGEVDIAGRITRRLGLPVYLGNDATLGATAEWRLGAGRGTDDLIYVMLSEGVGAGLVLGGRVHDGATGAAGEFGHVRAVADGHICRCGSRGCVETVAGARALVSALTHTRGPDCTLADLVRLAEHDAGVRRLLADAGRAIGHALAGLCTVLDPRVVVLGGDVAVGASGQVLVDAVRDALHQALPPVANHDLHVAQSALGARAEALGAALLAASRAGARIAGLIPRADSDQP
jgi:predicted NBD/HSP70 family sugar kinase